MNKDFYNHILNALKKDIRFDGRKKHEFREISVQTEVSSTAEGSCQVKCGDTEVIAGVKLQLEQPFQDRPDEGILIVNAERLPLSNERFESGPPDAASIELSRIIDRGIRESRMIDLKKLCIESGEKVWGVMVDILPLNSSGNLIDVCFMAAVIALKNARFPELTEDGVINYKKKTNKKLPITDTPIAVTIIKIGDEYVIDPVEEEENVLDSRLTIVYNSDDMLCALQKGGGGAITIKDVDKMTSLALEKSKELRKIIN